MYHIPTIKLQRSKNRIDDWFIVQCLTIVTLTILKIGNPHMPQSRKIKRFQIKNFKIMHVHWSITNLKNKKHGMWTN
jgi:hypothetical protein